MERSEHLSTAADTAAKHHNHLTERKREGGREGEGVRKGGKEGEGVREGGKEGGGKREREKLDLILFTQSSIHTDKHFNINTREGDRTNTQQHIISKNSHKLHILTDFHSIANRKNNKTLGEPVSRLAHNNNKP